MEAPKFTGKNHEKHEGLLHMMIFIFISNFVIFIFRKNRCFMGHFFWDALYLCVKLSFNLSDFASLSMYDLRPISQTC